jgi:hypothetical protein
MGARLCPPKVRWLLDRPVKPGDDNRMWVLTLRRILRTFVPATSGFHTVSRTCWRPAVAAAAVPAMISEGEI